MNISHRGRKSDAEKANDDFVPSLELLSLMWDAGFAAGVDFARMRAMRSPMEEVLPAPNPMCKSRVLHEDDLAVARFALAMCQKLAEARAKGRGGWQDKVDYPYERLCEDLLRHVYRGDPVDVGNYAMFLHQRGQRCQLPPPEAST